MYLARRPGSVQRTDANLGHRRPPVESVTRALDCSRALSSPNFAVLFSRAGRKNPHPNLAKNARLGWGTLRGLDGSPSEVRMGHPRKLLPRTSGLAHGLGCAADGVAVEARLEEQAVQSAHQVFRLRFCHQKADVALRRPLANHAQVHI